MAVMLSKITTVTSLLIICAASPPQPLYSPKQAMSSQNFVRHDVPLSYRYTTVHEYTTEKIDNHKYVPKIQYAPLYSQDELKMKNDLNTKVYQETNIKNQNREIRKGHLEPKEISGTGKTYYGTQSTYASYIPGHNIELKQSVNRRPGLNSNYLSNPETTSEFSPRSTEKINYHRAFAVYKMPQKETGPSAQPQEVVASNPPKYDPSNQYSRIVNKQKNPEDVHPFNADTYHIQQFANPSLERQLHRNQKTLLDIHELTKQIEAQRVSTHPKLNTMLLNLARVYNAHANNFKYLDKAQNKESKAQAAVKAPLIRKTPNYQFERDVSLLLPIRANSKISLNGLH